MSKITEPLEYSKEWTDSVDFPTTEYSETRVREDIQLLFDEIKSYINNTVITALNDNMDRIASLGGGGEVTHELMGPDSVGEDNIIDGSVTEFKYGDNSIPPTAYQDGSITSDKFDEESVTEYIETVSRAANTRVRLLLAGYDSLFPNSERTTVSTRRLRASDLGLSSFDGLDFIVQVWAEPSSQFTDHVAFTGVSEHYSWSYTIDRDLSEINISQSYDGTSMSRQYWIKGNYAIYVIENTRGDYTHDNT